MAVAVAAPCKRCGNDSFRGICVVPTCRNQEIRELRSKIAYSLKHHTALLEIVDDRKNPPFCDFLELIADRLVIHGDSEQADYVLALREKARLIKEVIASPKDVSSDETN